MKEFVQFVFVGFAVVVTSYACVYAVLVFVAIHQSRLMDIVGIP